MTTKLTFENRSLNPNVRRVGLFWGAQDVIGDVRPLTWQVVLRCPYLWHRTFEIDPALYVRFISRERNITPSVRVDRKVVFREAIIRPERNGEAIDVWVSVRRGHAYHKFQVLRSGAPLAEIQLPSQGDCIVRAPDRLTFAADITTRQGLRIDRREIGPGATSFDLHRVRAMRVAMYGGAPGPDSDPIRFFAYDIEME